MVDAVAITLPIKIYKDSLNKKQMKFWKRMEALGINKKTFYNNVNYELQNYYYGENIIKCHNCGASIDVTKSICDYCGTRVNSYQEWYMILNRIVTN